MNSTLLSLSFDVVLAVLLLATIGYCARLSKWIRLLQDNKSELSGMIAHFDQATERASHALNELQTVSKKITESLQLKLDKANFLADDMAFLIEKGTKLVAQLEQARSRSAPPVLSPAVTPEEHVPKNALEAVLQRLSSGNAVHAHPADQGMAAPVQPRTNAERELIHALKSGR